MNNRWLALLVMLLPSVAKVRLLHGVHPMVSLTIVSAMLLSGLIDLPRKLAIGPASATALLTGAYVSSAFVLWLVRPVLLKKVVAVMWPFLVLLAWGFSSFVWSRPNEAGLQNLLVISVFVGFTFLASYESYRNRKFTRLITRALVCAIWIAAALYALGLLLQGLRSNAVLGGLGSNAILESRPFALFAVLGVAYFVSEWRHGYRKGLWWAVVLVLLIGASLSRTALLVALSLFALSQVSLRSWRSWSRAMLVGILMVVLGYVALAHVEPLHNRFFQGDLYSIGRIDNGLR